MIKIEINITSREDVYKEFSSRGIYRFGIHEKHFANSQEVLEDMLKNRELKRCPLDKNPVYCLTKHGEAILDDYIKSGELREGAVPNFEDEWARIKMYGLFVPYIGVHRSRFDKINSFVFRDMIKNGEVEKQPHAKEENFYRLTEKGKKKLDEFLEFEEIEWTI